MHQAIIQTTIGDKSCIADEKTKPAEHMWDIGITLFRLALKADFLLVEKQLAKLLVTEGPEGSLELAGGLSNGHLHSWEASAALLRQPTASSLAEDAAQRMQSLLLQGEQAAALK